jgi:hypothetical protein
MEIVSDGDPKLVRLAKTAHARSLFETRFVGTTHTIPVREISKSTLRALGEDIRVICD